MLRTFGGMHTSRRHRRLVFIALLAACGGRNVATAGTSPVSDATTIESLSEAEVEIENPDWMVAAGDYVWTLSDAEPDDDLSVFALKAISIETNEVVITVNRGKSGCDSLGTSGQAVWVCDGDQVMQLDPATGETTAVIDFAMSWEQGPIPADQDGIWLVTRAGNELVRLGPSGVELGRAELPGVCDRVAVFEGNAFVSCPESQSVAVVDVATLTVTNEVEGLAADLMIAGEDRVWVGFAHDSGGVGWLTADGEVGRVEGSPDIGLGCMYLDGDSVWVRGANPHLARIDGASAEIVESYQSERQVGGGCVVRAGGSLWIGSLPFSKIWRLEI
jgi:hypothetical protein